MSYNVQNLEDPARDVDPDLRFMALEDFQKSLNNPKLQVKGVSSFIPILYKLLDDPVTDVQNQAIKSFAPLVRHIDDEHTMEVINHLFQEAEASQDVSRFTTSVPNLALRSIFQNSHNRFGKNLSRAAMESLLPQILNGGTMTLGRIEILIDLMKYLGSVLLLDEICAIRRALIMCAFEESGIVSKRSIVAVGVLLNHVKTACSGQLRLLLQFFNSIFAEIDSLYQNQDQTVAAKKAMFTLFLTILAHIKKMRAGLLSDDLVELLISTITDNLELASIGLDEDVEDLDIDILGEKNYLRDEILNTLCVLVPCIASDSLVEKHLRPITNILEAFIPYNPLATQDPDDDYDDDEMEFSEDEAIDEEEPENDDGLASQLRALALRVFGELLEEKPFILSAIFETRLLDQVVSGISDAVPSVSNQAIADVVTLARLVSEAGSRNDDEQTNQAKNLYNLFSGTLVPRIEKSIFQDLLVNNAIARFAHVEVLVETLICKMSDSLRDDFLDNLVPRLLSLNISLKSQPELIGLYEAVLDNYDLDKIPSLDIILRDLANSLNCLRAYSTSMHKFLQVSKIFYCKTPLSESQCELANELFFPAVTEGINSRHFSSDVRQQYLGNLSELLIQIPISEKNQDAAIQAFSESLDYEATVSYTIECLNHICESNPQLFDSMHLSMLIIEKLSSYLGSGDSALYGSSLTLIRTIFGRTQYSGDLKVIEVLGEKIIDLLNSSTDPHLIDKALYALGYIVELQEADVFDVEKILEVLAQFISLDTEDLKSSSLDFLAHKLANRTTSNGEVLWRLAIDKLDLSKFKSARFLSIIVTDCQLNEQIKTMEELLTSKLQTTAEPLNDFIFSIHFLGCLSSTVTETKFAFEDFLKILYESSDEAVCMAAARALGSSVFSDFQTKLPILLNHFQELSGSKDPKKSLLLVSIKQILKENSVQNENFALLLIWDTIIGAISKETGALAHEDIPAVKLAGEILSTVQNLDAAQNYKQKVLLCFELQTGQIGNDFLLYALIVVTKLSLNDSESSFDERIINRIVSHLPKQNLDLKLAIISTLLTAVYNKSKTIFKLANDVILPLVFDELSAKEEYRKVIPMGPYKYVVDEGLEVRKLSYELINAMISVNDTLTLDQEFQVDKVKIIEVLLAKGLSDNENDIINLAAGNLVQLIQKDPLYLTQIANLHELIQSLVKVLSRTLRNKATTQEAESHGDTLRAIIKLSKVANNALVSDSALTSEWSTYYNDLKIRHQLLFHGTG